MFGIDSLQFQQPSRFWWLLAALVALAGYLWLRVRLAPRVEKRLTTLDLLEQAERETGNRWRRWLPVVLSFLVLTALFAQWAEPVAATRVRRPARIVVACDNSLSTSAIEQEGGPTRLARIQALSHTIVDSGRQGDEFALVCFADEAILSVAPTADKARLHEAIDSLEPEVETDLGGALIEAHRLVQAAPAASHIIVLSDGAVSPGSSASVPRALEQLAADKIAVSTVLVGTPSGFVLNGDLRRPFPAQPKTMQRIAETTGGTYLDETMQTDNLLDAVYESLDRSERSFETVTQPIQWFILVALVLVVAAALSHLRLYRTRWAQ